MVEGVTPLNVLPGFANDHCQFAFAIDLSRSDFGNDDRVAGMGQRTGGLDEQHGAFGNPGARFFRVPPVIQPYAKNARRFDGREEFVNRNNVVGDLVHFVSRFLDEESRPLLDPLAVVDVTFQILKPDDFHLHNSYNFLSP